MRHAGFLALLLTLLAGLLAPLVLAVASNLLETPTASDTGRDPVKPVPWGKPRIG
ncbi:MAG: hypothetical protein RMJ98_10220 [Myxococcales bacterium]|nr:hypothetical protein [Polyangiaceae bacterium]MDW8249663.1 hypothetical protein [Myxococcales bacterium]